MIELMGRSPADYSFYFAIVPSGSKSDSSVRA
jgi:hypothetical protein